MDPLAVRSRDHALALDAADPLRHFRDQFHFPVHPGKEGGKVIYFTGNSLGLQPKGVRAAVEQELSDWSQFGVEGHFKAKHPWYSYHERFSESLARIVCAQPSEVVAMNGLTVNLHLLMVSFYRPQGRRVKVLTEQRPFPSDTYAIASQIAFHGGDPEHDLVEMRPRSGEHTLRTADILSRIADLRDELALVLFGGVNFYTGQLFNMQAITEAAHRAGAMAGFDLAHAAGNVPLALHDWGVDMACWCSYKYLNSGPGGVAGAFVHERHHGPEVPRFAGWWGHDKVERFAMGSEFKPMASAEAWQLSNAPVLLMAPHRASLDLFDQAGMEALIVKGRSLSSFLWHTLEAVSASSGVGLEIITPSAPEERGCQLSVVVEGRGKEVHERLAAEGVVLDWREPNVLRLAPVPLYNSFEDIWRFGELLNGILAKV
ncbi:MAG: kynureninase [Flavobacteriales bacterium]|nr:kynureninase [Flavobacteriales bacterium]